MAYVESHQALARHPKLLRLARKLNISKRESIGLLHMLWWWCLDYAPDGVLAGIGDDEIAMAVEWDGDPALLVDALVDTGWIDIDEGATLVVHDWMDYGGKLVQRKRANADRMRNARAETAASTAVSREAHVQHRCSARAEHVLSEKREEKKREEETRITPLPPTGGDTVDAQESTDRQDPLEERFARFWAAYPNKTGKEAARKVWRRLKPSQALTGVMLLAIERQRISDAWARENGRFIPHPATWLNQGRWDDEPVRVSPGLPSPAPVMSGSGAEWDGRDDSPENRAKFAAAWGVVRAEA